MPKDASNRLSCDVLIAGATPKELAWTNKSSQGSFPALDKLHVRGLTAYCLTTGPGPANAAIAMGLALARLKPGVVVNVGIAGAYPDCGLSPGDLAVATREHDHDLGVEDGVVPAQISVATIPHEFGELQHFAASRTHLDLLRKLCPPASFGAFVTSGIVTNSVERAQGLKAAYDAVAENMEGASVARACLYFGVDFVELRAISNIVGPRDVKSWKMAQAIDAYAQATIEFMRKLTHED